MTSREQPAVVMAVPDQHQVLHESGAWIHRTAYRLHVRMPWADVDDMKQQGVLTALELRVSFDPNYGVPFTNYIKPRVFGAMVDLSRKTGWIKRWEKAYIAEMDTVSEEDSLSRIIAVEDAETLAAEIEKLPQDERTVISLFYFDEMSNKEVAVIMKISEVRVVRHRKRALALLAHGIDARIAETTDLNALKETDS